MIRSGGRDAPGRRGRKCGHAEATLQRNFAVNRSEETWLQLSRGQGPGGCFLFSSWEIPVCVVVAEMEKAMQKVDRLVQ